MNKEEVLYNQIYERTKDFGRSQFIKELMKLENEKKKLEEQLRQKMKEEYDDNKN